MLDRLLAVKTLDFTMIISWLGDAGIRLQIKDTVVIIDPPGTDTGFKPTKQAAHIVALTEKAGRDATSISGEPFLIQGPGEYERQNVFVYGIELPTDAGRVHYRLEAEELSIGHLGGLNKKLENGQLGSFEGVDILFVPVGGKSVLDAERAAELVSQVEPRIVIPIQYRVSGSTSGYAGVDAFIKEMGGKGGSPVDKLKITKRDLPVEETQLTVLSL